MVNVNPLNYEPSLEEKVPSTSSKYNGRKYRLVSQNERDFSGHERFKRVLLGVIAVVFSLGFALLFKPVRNLFTKDQAIHQYDVLTPAPSSTSNNTQAVPNVEESKDDEQELQNGVHITEEIISKIQRCMGKVLNREAGEGVTLYNSQDNHRVFSLDTAPEYIFKMKANDSIRSLSSANSMKERYQMMVKAQTVCRTHQLGLLVIPKAVLVQVEVNGKKYDIIAERKLDINPNENAQEQYFEECGSSLDETIKQLATFICLTGYSDVEWRNIPVLNDNENAHGPRKIALIDIEELTGQQIGLYGGGWGRRGLVRCVNEEQGRMVNQIAKQYQINTSPFEEAHLKRVKEIEEGQRLKEFYKKNGIKGNEPLQVDIDSLGLDLDKSIEKGVKVIGVDGKITWQQKTITLRDVAKDLIREINKTIQNKPENASIKGKRNVVINCSAAPFTDYFLLGLPKRTFSIHDHEDKLWLQIVINALINKGYLYNSKSDNGVYHIQA